MPLESDTECVTFSRLLFCYLEGGAVLFALVVTKRFAIKHGKLLCTLGGLSYAAVEDSHSLICLDTNHSLVISRPSDV